MSNFAIIDLECHKSNLVELIEEYFEWLYTEVRKKYKVEVLPDGITYRQFAELIVDEFAFFNPPEGISYILFVDEEAAGMGALRKLNSTIGEITRMYIRPQHRGIGLRKELVELLMKKGKEFRFSSIFLCTGVFMQTALHLYRSFGFYEREEYPESEVPQEMKPFWLFMEKKI